MPAKAITLGIEKIDAADSGGYLLFGEDTLADPVQLVQLVQNEGHIYRMQGANRLKFAMELDSPADRFAQVEKLLDILAPNVVETSVMAS